MHTYTAGLVALSPVEQSANLPRRLYLWLRVIYHLEVECKTDTAMKIVLIRVINGETEP